jgi:hypothetical protein
MKGNDFQAALMEMDKWVQKWGSPMPAVESANESS